MTEVFGNDNAAARDEWVREKLAGIPEGWSLLDVGCGTQPYRKDCGHLQYIAQDSAQYDGLLESGLQVSEWKYGKLDITSDICAMPVASGSIDSALCTEVLEHVPDPVEAISELARVIRSGGYLILTAPFCSITHFAPMHYSTGFSKYWYEKHLPALGFSVVEMQPNGNFFAFVAQELKRSIEMYKRYASRAPVLVPDSGLFCWGKVIQYLEQMNDFDQGSAETLCFGWHVLARKR